MKARSPCVFAFAARNDWDLCVIVHDVSHSLTTVAVILCKSKAYKETQIYTDEEIVQAFCRFLFAKTSSGLLQAT